MYSFSLRSFVFKTCELQHHVALMNSFFISFLEHGSPQALSRGGSHLLEAPAHILTRTPVGIMAHCHCYALGFDIRKGGCKFGVVVTVDGGKL